MRHSSSMRRAAAAASARPKLPITEKTLEEITPSSWLSRPSDREQVPQKPVDQAALSAFGSVVAGETAM